MKQLIKAILLVLLTLSTGTLYAQLQGQPYIDSVVRALPQQKEDTNKVNLLRNIAYVSYRVGKPDSTLKYAGMQLALATKLQWQKGLAYGNRMMGLGYEGRNELKMAVPYYEKALNIFEQINVKKAAEGAFELGEIHYILNENAQAIQYFFRSLKICERAGICDYAARCNTGIAAVHGRGKDFATAVEYHLKAMRIAEQCKDIDSADLMGVYSNIAISYQYKGDCASSLPYCFKALESALHLGDVSIAANMYGNICLAYTKLREYEKAVNYGQRALTFSDSVRDEKHVAWSLYELGHAYLSFITDTVAPVEGQKASTGNMGAAGKPALVRIALNYLERSLDSNRGKQDEVELAVKVYEDLAKAYRLTHEWEKALRAHDMYITLKDSLFSKETAMQLQAEKMNYAFEKKEAATQAQQEKKDIQQRNIRNSTLAGMAGLLVFSVVVMRQRNKVKKEKARSEELLLNILPEEVAEELKEKGSAEAKLIDEATVLFTDFKGFTQLSEQLSPKELVNEINTCFSAFDNIMQKHGVEKIKTIGDAYMAAGGLPTPNKTHAEDVVKAALEIQDFMHRHKEEREAAGKLFFEIRIGVHTGPVVAGIVGIKKFAYDIWGDTVNTASRMESSGNVGMVNISQTTYELVKDKFNCEYRGEVEAKGKGGMKMYFVN
ncbi:MAG: hypothetical protein K0Q79_418 [Flavipsychrobacter sp.]|jgi:class 3 adenylate cyclase|nr:hypothetical protein [Flavipsychrobacter sp.]